MKKNRKTNIYIFLFVIYLFNFLSTLQIHADEQIDYNSENQYAEKEINDFDYQEYEDNQEIELLSNEEKQGIRTLSSLSSSSSAPTSNGGDSGYIGNGVPNISLHTGAATLSIPIKVTPGRNGLTPSITMAYSNYNSNSWLGIGWSLGLGVIQRSTKKGVNYNSNDYISMANGSNNILIARKDIGENYYTSKIESNFSTYYKNPSNSGWIVTSREGIKYYYGSTSNSRQENNHGIFKWCLDRIEDTNGNYILITYIKDNGKIYPKKIQYTGHDNLSPNKSIEFYLEDRLDITYSFISKNKVTMRKRLKSIVVKSHSNIVCAYQLSYITSNRMKRSLLERVKMFGSDADIDNAGNILRGSALPAMDFRWSEAEDEFDFEKKPEAIDSNKIDNGSNIYFGDFNGDAITDVMWYNRKSGGNLWFINNGIDNNGKLNYKEYPNPISPGYIDNGSGIYFGDWNGDGKKDIMWYSWETGHNRWFINNGDMTFIIHEDPIWREKINHGLIYLGDFNNDSKTDVMWYRKESGGNLWFINNGINYNGKLVFTLSPNKINAGQINNGTGIYLGDWNSDGISDLMWYNKEVGTIYGLSIMVIFHLLNIQMLLILN